ncbi:TPA: hypothetical protein DCX15_01215 [bacterium]|nr:hypothetical protein [bacterium]
MELEYRQIVIADIAAEIPTTLSPDQLVFVKDTAKFCSVVGGTVIPVAGAGGAGGGGGGLGGFPMSAPAGTAAAPSYTFAGNTDTGVYHPEANALGFAAAGVERVRIKDDKTGFGTSAPETTVDIKSNSVTTSPLRVQTRATVTGGGFDPALMPGWNHRRQINVSNPGTAQTDYQISIVLDTQTLIADGKLQSQGQDIRFTQANGSTIITNYWIEHDTMNTTTTRIWVRVPNIPAGSSTLFVYYANPTAPAQTSGDNTFLFFDGFIGTSIDTGKWPTVVGTFTVSGGTIRVNQNSYMANTNFDFRSYSALSLEARARPNATNLTGMVSAVSSNYFGVAEMSSTPRGFNFLWWGTGVYRERASETSGSENYWGTIGTTNWNRIAMSWISGTSIKYTTTAQGTTTDTVYIPTNTAAQPWYPHVTNRQNTAGLSLDWIFIRRYVATDPGTSLGAEQTAGSAVEEDRLVIYIQPNTGNMGVRTNDPVTALTIGG